MDHVRVLLSSYAIAPCISYPTEQAMDALSLDLAPPPEGEAYTTGAAALAAINKFAIRHGYGVTERRSKPDKYGIPRKYWFQCDCGSKIKVRDLHPDVEKQRMRLARSKNCPFKITCARDLQDRLWRITVEDPTHNHVATYPETHPVHRKLTAEDKLDIKAMSAAGATSGEIVNKLQSANSGRAFIRQDIYNARMDIRRVELGPRTATQALMEELGKGEDFYLDFQKDNEFKLTRLFYSYKKSQQMLKENPDILVIDATYKTNQYGLPCVDIIGQTMIGTSFFVGFFFIDKEDNGGYDWLMGRLRALYDHLQLPYPRVIATDNQRSLINAVMGHFPLSQTKHLLCLWHINKAVVTHCKPAFKDCDEEDWKAFVADWNKVLYSNTFMKFTDNWYDMNEAWSFFVEELQYLDDIWLTPFYQCCVKYWTKQFIHFGMTTTSIGEGAHWTLKQSLKVSSGDLKQVS